jgi:hypothetical protein
VQLGSKNVPPSVMVVDDEPANKFGVKLSSPDQQLEVAALVRRLELMQTLL